MPKIPIKLNIPSIEQISGPSPTTAKGETWTLLVDFPAGKMSFEAFAQRAIDHHWIDEALTNLEAGNSNAVTLFLRLILNIQPKGPNALARFFEALWNMSRSPAWKAKGFDDIFAYVARAIHNEQKRLERYRLIEGDDPQLGKKTAGNISRFRRTDPAILDLLPSPGQIQAAQESLEHLRHLATPMQRKVADLRYQGYKNKEIAQLLKITADTVRRHLCDLNKTLRKNI